MFFCSSLDFAHCMAAGGKLSEERGTSHLSFVSLLQGHKVYGLTPTLCSQLPVMQLCSEEVLTPFKATSKEEIEYSPNLLQLEFDLRGLFQPQQFYNSIILF